MIHACMPTMSGGDCTSLAADSLLAGAGSPASALIDQADRILNCREPLLYLQHYDVHCENMQRKHGSRLSLLRPVEAGSQSSLGAESSVCDVTG